MARCGRLALGTLFVTGILTAYLLNTPVPPGFSEPWKLRVSFVPNRFIRNLLGPAVRTLFGQEALLGVWRHALGVKTEVPSGIETQDLDFDGIPVRLYVPDGGANSTAGIVFIHGGGFSLGNVDAYNDISGWLALSTGMTVVSISYRLAPEHPYPAAFQDCEVATKYFLKNAQKFGVDPSRVAVMGDSAGGNLAAAVSLRLRDEKVRPALKIQVLLYPVIQSIDYQLPSHVDDRGPVLSDDMTVFCPLWYAVGDDSAKDQVRVNNHTPAHIKRKYADIIDRSLLPKYMTEGHPPPSMHDGDPDLWAKLGPILQDPYYSPGVASDLRNLPMAFVFTSTPDPLRDEGVIYAKRLEKAGNQVKHVHYASGMHGLIQFCPFKECKTLRKETAQYLVDNL